MSQIASILPSYTLMSRDRLWVINRPQVMGILNLTPDSFFDGGKYNEVEKAVERVGQMLEEGADIIDIGGASTKPGSPVIDPVTEQERILPVIRTLRTRFPEIWISVDTYHASTAGLAMEAGGDMINDISGGNIDPAITEVVKRYRCPYILMHMQGLPENMQDTPVYEDVVKEVAAFFSEKIVSYHKKGIKDIIIDPGWGFGKDTGHNYRLLKYLQVFVHTFHVPVLAGLSRKSMINRVLGTKAADALNGTTALNMVALMNGASILRVHDVKEAREVVSLFEEYKKA